MTDRIAFWIDLENPYVTYDNDYIESLWWILKTLWERGLLFRDYKVTMHCPRCGTSLSDHEVSLGFEDDVDDPSVWVRFRHRPTGHPLDELLAGAAFLAWTTTPWTLPANAGPGGQAGGDLRPGRVHRAAGGASRAPWSWPRPWPPPSSARGLRRCWDLQGRGPGRRRATSPVQGVGAGGEQVDLGPPTASWRTTSSRWRTAPGSSTSRRPTATWRSGRKYGLPTLFSVDLAGASCPAFDRAGFGRPVLQGGRPADHPNLQDRGLLFRCGRVTPRYPFCWRCRTPLLYYAKPSWYIRTTAKKASCWRTTSRSTGSRSTSRMAASATGWRTTWTGPLSRERYWGTPLPIWVLWGPSSGAGCGTPRCSARWPSCPRRPARPQGSTCTGPAVDEVTWTCRVRRGRCAACPMSPTAGSTRGHAGGPVALPLREPGAVRGRRARPTTSPRRSTRPAAGSTPCTRSPRCSSTGPAFENVICLGHILDIKGEKMSKSRGNVVDPWQLLDEYGADATRWYMYASAPPYNPRRFAPDQVGEVLRQFMLTLWNTYAFFVTYANLDGWKPPGRGRPRGASGLTPSTAGRWRASTPWCGT